MANVAHIELRLSGGAANTDQRASLGGAMSGHRVFSQSCPQPANVTGVTIVDVMGCTEGNWVLRYDTQLGLRWSPEGNGGGDDVLTPADGLYAIPAYGVSGGYVLISVVAAELPAANVFDTLAVSDRANETFDNISVSESVNGDTEYRCLYIANAHATDSALGVKVWVNLDPAGEDTLAIGLDPSGVGDGASSGVAVGPVADEGTAPAGVTFSVPATESAGLAVGDLGPGQAAAIWMKRTVPAGTQTSSPGDRSELGFSAVFA